MAKTTIWYEFTDKADVQSLRDAADRLEQEGYVKLLLPNVDLSEPAIPNGGSGGAQSTGLGASGSWTPQVPWVGVAGTSGGAGAAGSGTTGGSDGSWYGGGGCTLPPDHKGPCRPG